MHKNLGKILGVLPQLILCGSLYVRVAVATPKLLAMVGTPLHGLTIIHVPMVEKHCVLSRGI